MTNWRTIDTARKDGMPILVWHDHDSDSYVENKTTGSLTPYGCYAECNRYHKTSGPVVAVWLEGYSDDDSDGWGEPTYYPGWWFVDDTNFETPIAPTHWMPIEKPSEDVIKVYEHYITDADDIDVNYF